jgi:hypothetical protein
MRALDEENASEPCDGTATALIAAVAQALAEAAHRLDNTVGEVTGKLLGSGSRVDPDLVTRLQDFDRLNQEFVALAAVLGDMGRLPQLAALDHAAALALVPVSDLRRRLMARLEPPAEVVPADENLIEAEF